MSWMARLYETYEMGRTLSLADEDQLMPISHTLQNAHIHIAIDGEGNFLRAQVLEKTQIILPATEKSAGRSGSRPPPHPLADKLQYLAADYPTFGGVKKSFHSEYKELLEHWCQSEFSHPAALAVRAYISKGCIIADLVEHQIVYAKDGTLLTQWTDNEETPALFKVLPKETGKLDQGNALVCWSVETPGKAQSKTWLDISLYQSWIDFDSSNNQGLGLCLIKGELRLPASNHPAKIRHTGDKAKLISANDSSGFTFRGRFVEAIQANSISFEVTQKAHNALRWLLSRQGYRNDDQSYVAWAISGKAIPEPTTDFFELWESAAEVADDHSDDLGQSYATKLNKAMNGYLGRDGLEPHESIAILGIDSATPGRMSVIYYRETIAEEFINTLTQWHSDLAWPQRRKVILERSGNKKTVEKTSWDISAPTIYKVAGAVYGDLLKSTDSLKKNLLERLMPCITEGKPIPLDIVRNAVKRATNRVGYKSDEFWLWEQNLGIACSLYRGYHKRTPDLSQRKDYDMALEEDNNSRDYLYGRLLAVAENIESYALYKADEKRPTTAERLMQRFADRPFSSWRNLELALQPYLQRLKTSSGGFLKIRKDLLDEILSKFEVESFSSDKALSGEFLLGFHCQRLELNKSRNTEIDKD